MGCFPRVVRRGRARTCPHEKTTRSYAVPTVIFWLAPKTRAKPSELRGSSDELTGYQAVECSACLPYSLVVP